MASVYKSLSKKKAQPPVAHDDAEDADVSMHDLLDDPDETSDSDDYEDEDEQDGRNGGEDVVATKSQSLPSGYMPKTRVLMLTSRGVTHRYVAYSTYPYLTSGSPSSAVIVAVADALENRIK